MLPPLTSLYSLYGDYWFTGERAQSQLGEKKEGKERVLLFTKAHRPIVLYRRLKGPQHCFTAVGFIHRLSIKNNNNNKKACAVNMLLLFNFLTHRRRNR